MADGEVLYGQVTLDAIKNKAVLGTDANGVIVGGAETDPLSVHLNQSSPQTFTGGALTGSGLLKVVSGLLGLDTNSYLTSFTETDPLSIHLNQSSPQTFTGGTLTGSGLLKVTSGLLGLDTTSYLTGTSADASYLKLDQTTPQTIINGAPLFNVGLKSPKVYPSADSTTAVGIFKANGTTSILNVDTTDSWIGINNTAPAEALSVGSSAAGGSIRTYSTLGAELCPALQPGGWTCTGGWSASGGSLVSAGAGGTARPASAIVPVAGTTYAITYTISATTFTVYSSYTFGGSAGPLLNHVGTYTDYIIARDTTNLVFSANGADTITITSLSIKALTAGTGNLTIDGNFSVRGLINFVNPVGFGIANNYTVPLAINTDGTSAKALRIYRSNVTTQYIDINEDGGASHELNAVGNNKPFNITNDGSSNGIYLKSGGYNAVSCVVSKVGIGATTSPTAALHLPAGTATANTSPLKFTSGTNLTTAETGAIEYDGTSLYFTATGTLREMIHFGWNAGATLTAGTTTTITDTRAKTTSTIFLQATSAAFVPLGAYISTKNNGSFVITTTLAAGTETFDYLIVN